MRFTTAAELVNELIEAKNKSELNRVTNRWTRYELIVIDEMAYVAMPESAAELLFQIIAGERKGGGDRDNESAVFRVDHDVSECAVMQGDAGPVDGPGAHHRDGDGVVPVPENAGKEERWQGMNEGTKPGMLWVDRVGARCS